MTKQELEGYLTCDPERKRSCNWSIGATVIYVVLAWPICILSVFNFVMFVVDSTHSAIVLYSMLFLWCCVPLSLPVSLYLVWKSYWAKDYKKSRKFCFLPLFVAVLAYVVCIGVMAIISWFD